MRPLTLALAAGLLAAGGCERIAEDPDVKEARAALEDAIDDDADALKAVREEAEAAREREQAGPAD